MLYNLMEMYCVYKKYTQLKNTKIWTKEIYTRQERETHEFFQQAFRIIKERDDTEFRKITRMSVRSFQLLAQLLEERLTKTSRRQPIEPDCRLVLTLTERLFKLMTDLIITEGYAAVGYEYVNVDDCWLEKHRDSSGRLVADRKRFPNGMKALSDYIHSRGLKFGIYEDYGNYTCAGYPGIIGHQQSDANQFAEWNVDYVKLDGCYALPQNMDAGYAEFEKLLNLTGKHMVYSCSWPVYQIYAGLQPNFSAVKTHCNLWRNFDDIQDSWTSVESIIDYYGNNQDIIAPNAGPGHWNDPDMLIIGNFGLSYEQAKTQFAIWSILAAPLLMSVDLRTIRPEFRDILQNRKIIAVDQDNLGIQGRRIYKHKGIEIWSRPIGPIHQTFYSYAIVFVNRRTDGTPSDVAVTLKELGLISYNGYRVEDLYEHVDYGILFPGTKIKVKVNPSGVVMLKAEIQYRKYHKIAYETSDIFSPNN